MAQGQVGETHLQHGAKRFSQLLVPFEEFIGILGGHGKDFFNVLSLIPVGQGFFAVPLALTGFADSGYRIHKHQFRNDDASAAAAGTGTKTVEGEKGSIYAVFRCHHPADLIKEP